MKRIIASIMLLLLLAASPAASQQYYAVLISGNGPDQGILSKRSSELTGPDYDRLSFWHDVFTMRRALVESGYPIGNIYVLFKDGQNFPSPNPEYQGQIVTGNATYANVQYTLTTTLKNRMTTNDVLFLFTSGHGNTNGANAFLTLANEVDVSSDTFASWVNQIPCRKRIVVMAQCHGGAFAPALVDGIHPTIALTAGTGLQETRRADNVNPDRVGELENEMYDGNPYHHSEFNYHAINAIRNRTIMNSAPLEGLDFDGISGVCLSEIWTWAEEKDSDVDADPSHWDFYFGSHGIGAISFVNCSLDRTYYFTPPAAPSNVAISGLVGQHPTVTWSANTESDLDGYKVYRKVTPNEQQFLLIATVGKLQTSYTDPNVTIRTGGTGGQWAQYYVKAFDYVQNLSNPSATVSKAVNYNPPKTGAGVDEMIQDGIPNAFMFANPFPNPFNPSTQIRFALPTDANVKLVVTDVLGCEVARLAHGIYQAGYHIVAWDAAKEASGTYFARIEVSGPLGNILYAETAKLLLMK